MTNSIFWEAKLTSKSLVFFDLDMLEPAEQIEFLESKSPKNLLIEEEEAILMYKHIFNT